MALVAELDDRIAKCNKILEENPNSQIFAALAEAYRKKGELEKAFRSCQNGLRIHPNYGSAHMVMAKINFDKGLFDWAEMEVNKAVELDGHSHATDLLLAEIYIYKGEFARATKILDRLHSADRNNQQILKLLEIARKLPLEASPKSPTVGAISAATTEAPRPETKESAPDIKSAEKISMGEFLDSLFAITGVDGILLLNREGLVADSRWEEKQAADEFGAVAGEIERIIRTQLESSPFGKYESILLEADDIIINILSLKESLLLIKANKRINLGTMRLKMVSLLGKLDSDMSQI
ncbi:putative TPR protein [Candidatus Zixiibacteriota bacterium]|nr:putative TPR protein [candidate division Zixibacteria bacterium]